MLMLYRVMVCDLLFFLIQGMVDMQVVSILSSGVLLMFLAGELVFTFKKASTSWSN